MVPAIQGHPTSKEQKTTGSCSSWWNMLMTFHHMATAHRSDPFIAGNNHRVGTPDPSLLKNKC